MQCLDALPWLWLLGGSALPGFLLIRAIDNTEVKVAKEGC